MAQPYAQPRPSRRDISRGLNDSHVCVQHVEVCDVTVQCCVCSWLGYWTLFELHREGTKWEVQGSVSDVATEKTDVLCGKMNPSVESVEFFVCCWRGY
jgi:hypothetical protein